jgi:myo-inositol-1(or 4)-monophosphatase
VTDDIDELLAVAVEVARTAGNLLRSRPVNLHASTKSTPTDAVTVMDRAADQLILDELAKRRPGDHVLAEESGRHGDIEGDVVTWVVDPLDGTVNYLYGIPQFSVSIAAQRNGESVAGAVYDVMHDEMYAATRGGGATRDGQAIRCSTQRDPALALIATGFAYSAEARARQADVVHHVLPRVRDIRRFGSAALDLCAVACGRVDGYYESGMQPWDWAAGSLVAAEAGARVGGLGGRPPGVGTTIAANPALFDQLENLLTEAGEGRNGS